MYSHQAMANPSIVAACSFSGRLERLTTVSQTLDTCEKVLTQFLDLKRVAFPRFYFVSSASLLDILANSSSPSGVLPHLPACFDALAGLALEPSPEAKRRAAGGAQRLWPHVSTTVVAPCVVCVRCACVGDCSSAPAWMLARWRLCGGNRGWQARGEWFACRLAAAASTVLPFPVVHCSEATGEKKRAQLDTATALIAKDGESVQLDKPLLLSGPVESWLSDVVAVMKTTLRAQLTASLEAACQWEVRRVSPHRRRTLPCSRAGPRSWS
jgi:hypothetical protein